MSESNRLLEDYQSSRAAVTPVPNASLEMSAGRRITSRIGSLWNLGLDCPSQDRIPQVFGHLVGHRGLTDQGGQQTVTPGVHHRLEELTLFILVHHRRQTNSIGEQWGCDFSVAHFNHE